MGKIFDEALEFCAGKNATETQVPLALPTLKIVLTGTEYGYRRDDEVFVIPLGYLWD